MGARKTNRWVLFVGNCDCISEYLKSKKNVSVWILLKALVSLSRGFGQIIFANNPLSGAFIIITMSITNSYETAVGLISGLIGLIFSVFIGQNPKTVSNGLTVRNPLMIGIYTATYTYTLFELNTENIKIWIFLIFAIIFSVYVTSALDNILSNFGLPFLTLPYNIVQYLLLLSYKNIQTDYENLQAEIEDQLVTHGNMTTPGEQALVLGYDNASLVTDTLNISQHQETLVWGGVFSGIVLSTAQVVNLEDVALGAVMYLSLIVYSPIMVLFSAFGAFCGCLLGVGLSTSGYAAVYKGVWGYNTLLCAAASASHYYILTVHTLLASLVCVVFCTVLQYVIAASMLAVNLPLITLPSNISLLLFLSLTARSDKFFPRPEHISFPEKQRYDFKYRGAETTLTPDEVPPI